MLFFLQFYCDALIYWLLNFMPCALCVKFAPVEAKLERWCVMEPDKIRRWNKIFADIPDFDGLFKNLIKFLLIISGLRANKFQLVL
jgi:hypothetical protein